MSARVHVLIQFDGGSYRQSITSLLNGMMDCGVLEVFSRGRSGTLDEPRALGRLGAVGPTPQASLGSGDLVMNFQCSSGKRIALDLNEEASDSSAVLAGGRFAFSLNDSMDEIRECWTGAGYAGDQVTVAMKGWETEARELFRHLCGIVAPQGEVLVRKAFMCLEPGWSGPEACSMAYHADVREFLMDIVRCYLSLVHGVPMVEMLGLTFDDGPWDYRSKSPIRRDELYRSFVGNGSTGPALRFLQIVTRDGLTSLARHDAAATQALFELVAEEHRQRASEHRRSMSKKSQLDGVGMMRALGRSASLDVLPHARNGMAVMTNPCGTLLDVYQMAYELST